MAMRESSSRTKIIFHRVLKHFAFAASFNSPMSDCIFTLYVCQLDGLNEAEEKPWVEVYTHS